MKVMLLAPRPPYPPRSGAEIRLNEMVRYFGTRHRVTLVYFNHLEEPNAPPQMQDICERVVAVPHPAALSAEDFLIGKRAPAPVKWFGTTAMYEALRACEPQTFDAVLVESLYMTLYRELLPPQSVLLEQNIESQMYRQFARWSERAPQGIEKSVLNATWRMMEQYENRVWAQFALRAAVSREEQEVMQRRCAVGKTIVVENGVNLARYPLLTRRGRQTLLFTGAMDYVANADACVYMVREIMPRIWEQEPDVTLLLAGRNPSETVSGLEGARVKIIANPEDMTGVAAQATVAVVPLRIGGGTSLKVLEALAWGLPVVSTSVGCRGLAVTDGHDVLVRDDAGEFAGAVVSVLRDEELAGRLRAHGRSLVEERYGWEEIFGRLEKELVGRGV